MPIVQCRKCQTDVLVLGFDQTGPKHCPGCGARLVSADPRSDLTRLSTAAIEAKRSIASPPRFRRSGPRVTR